MLTLVILQQRLRGLNSCLFCLPTSLLALLLCFLLAYNGLSIFYLNLPLLARIPVQPANFSSSPPSSSISRDSHSSPQKLVSSSVMYVVREENSPQFLKPEPALETKKQKQSGNKKKKKVLKPFVLNSDKRFSTRIEEFFFAPEKNCTEPKFFMTWISDLDSFGDRERFSVESLFKSHPSSCLAIVSETMDSDRGNDILRPFVDAGFKVAALSPDYDSIFAGTPAEKWLLGLRSGAVDPGRISIGQNLSNLLRLGLLYRYGGVYADTDVVFLRSFSGLRNAVGAQTADPETGKWTRLNNAVLVFDRAHPVVLELIAEFARTFDGSKWGHNGPYLVSRVAARLEGSAVGPAVLPPSSFYPVLWMDIRGLFRGPGKDKRLSEILAESYAVHLWNHESKSLKVESGSVIDSMMRRYCVLCHGRNSSNNNMLL